MRALIPFLLVAGSATLEAQSWAATTRPLPGHDGGTVRQDVSFGTGTMEVHWETRTNGDALVHTVRVPFTRLEPPGDPEPADSGYVVKVVCHNRTALLCMESTGSGTSAPKVDHVGDFALLFDRKEDADAAVAELRRRIGPGSTSLAGETTHCMLLSRLGGDMQCGAGATYSPANRRPPGQAPAPPEPAPQLDSRVLLQCFAQAGGDAANRARCAGLASNASVQQLLRLREELERYRRAGGIVPPELEALLSDEALRARAEREKRDADERAVRQPGAPCKLIGAPAGVSAWGHYGLAGECVPGFIDLKAPQPAGPLKSEPLAPPGFKPGEPCTIPDVIRPGGGPGRFDNVGNCVPLEMSFPGKPGAGAPR